MDALKVGNIPYFLYIAFTAFALFLLVFLLRKRSDKTKRIVLLSLLFFNFALHFLKQAFPPYIDRFPTSFAQSTMQNICAVSTVLFPFFYLFKKQNILHDYAYFIGVVGGAAGVFYPTETFNKPPLAFDTIRFYVCHIILLIVPLSAAILNMYRPRLKMFWAIPFMFLLWQAIICANDYTLIATGLVKGTFKDLFNPGFRNSSFTFGIRPEFSWSKPFFDPFIPSFFKTDAFNLNDGNPFYFPVLWLIGPAFIYFIPFYIIVSSPFWICDLVKKKKNSTPTRPFLE